MPAETVDGGRQPERDALLLVPTDVSADAVPGYDQSGSVDLHLELNWLALDSFSPLALARSQDCYGIASRCGLAVPQQPPRDKRAGAEIEVGAAGKNCLSFEDGVVDQTGRPVYDN
jgi:hypothetical protein